MPQKRAMQRVAKGRNDVDPATEQPETNRGAVRRAARGDVVGPYNAQVCTHHDPVTSGVVSPGGPGTTRRRLGVDHGVGSEVDRGPAQERPGHGRLRRRRDLNPREVINLNPLSRRAP